MWQFAILAVSLSSALDVGKPPAWVSLAELQKLGFVHKATSKTSGKYPGEWTFESSLFARSYDGAELSMEMKHWTSDQNPQQTLSLHTAASVPVKYDRLPPSKFPVGAKAAFLSSDRGQISLYASTPRELISCNLAYPLKKVGNNYRAELGDQKQDAQLLEQVGRRSLARALGFVQVAKASSGPLEMVSLDELIREREMKTLRANGDSNLIELPGRKGMVTIALGSNVAKLNGRFIPLGGFVLLQKDRLVVPADVGKLL